VSACFAGAPASVYRVSAEAQANRSNFTISEPADIVMIDSHPIDTNIFQASHALYAALGILKEGGEIVIVTPLLEQVSQLSATLAKNLSESREMLLNMSRSGALSKHPALGAQLAAIREVGERASRVTFVSQGPGMNDPAKFGFHQSNDAQAALNGAISRLGANSRVALITHGGLSVPRIA
jgi:nickel-dependent lactate racemase